MDEIARGVATAALTLQSALRGPLLPWRHDASTGAVDTAVVDSPKALDPNRPIREADFELEGILR